jgi:hypothetical protein
MIETGTETEFETHDIYLASYLKIAGCTLVRRRKQANRVYFVFNNPAGSVKDLREAFFSGQAKVSAHEYSTTIISFKQLCFDP